MDTPYKNFTQDLKNKGEKRELKPYSPSTAGQIRRGVMDYVNFSCNDYLNLSRSRILRMRAISFAQQYGMGSTASRLMTGNYEIYEAIEQKMADAVGKPSALVFNSGYQANATILSALMDRSVLGTDAVMFCDRFCHHSILQAAKLSDAEMQRYRHLDLNHLEDLLKKSQQKNIARFIVSETLFGMDGDRADIPNLIALAKKYNAFLYLDDAHAVGVLGKNGFGLAADYASDIDCIVGTFGKAFGSAGAYVACNHVIREYLINRCGGFMFSTALPPVVWGAIDAAIEVVPTLTQDRSKIIANADYLRSALRSNKFNLAASDAQIVPIIAGGSFEAVKMQKDLESLGILCVAVRPPTVSKDSARLRISITAAHSIAQIDQLIASLYQVIGNDASIGQDNIAA